MTVTEALAAELAAHPGRNHPGFAPLAAVAERLADLLDVSDVRPYVVVGLSRELRAVLSALAELVPPVEQESVLSQLRRMRLDVAD